MKTMPIHDHDPRDYPDFIEGFPEPDDAADALLPWGEEARPIANQQPTKSVKALCLPCYAIHEVGSYVYENEPIELEDGSTTTLEDWKSEADKARLGKGRRRRFHCPRCDFPTDHVAEV